MKNIRTFESYTVEEIPDNSPIKPYGVPYSLTNLNVGDKLIYSGTQCEVKSVDQYLLILTSLESGKQIRSNQAMFNKNGFIGR
jgi:hypothetical protein